MPRDDGLPPRALAAAIVRLRARTLALLDDLDEADLEREALPARGSSSAWTVADVLRHLASTDRRSVLVVHLARFRSGEDLGEFEDANDRDLARLRAVPTSRLRRELDVWGRRLAVVVRLVPAPVAALRVPTAFGRLPLAWLAGLRLYDEWVHQDDIARVLGRPEPPMPTELADLLAAFQLHALAAALSDGDRRVGTAVTVTVTDAPGVAPRVFEVPTSEAHDGGAPPGHRDGPGHVAVDAAAFCLLAADRVPWRDLEAKGRLVRGGNPVATAALLDTVRVV